MARALSVPSRVIAAATFKHTILIAGAVITAFPFFWMVTTSFKSFAEAQSYPPVFWPTVWHFENWVEAWNFPTTLWARSFANTLFVATVSTIATVITAVLAAYAFARMRFRGRNVLFAVFLLTIFIPNEATLIPNFVLITKYLGWYNSYQAQIVPFLASVFSIFLLRQFFMSIPQELQDSARMDGAGNVRFLWSIALPLVRPALITVSLLTFLASWNAFLWPLLVTSSPELRPIQVALMPFSSEAGTQYHLLMAGATFVILPTLVVYLIAQRYFIEGVARTGIRG